MLQWDDTIAALASGAGPALRSIVRVSGPETCACLSKIFTAEDRVAWDRARQPRRHTGQLHCPALEHGIPCAVYLWPTARSYTAQPLAELHLPGSPVLHEVVLQTLFGLGVRPANAGEFTLRAFLGGRLDLVQAEAVLGVIDAQDSRELECALQQLAGGISQGMGAVRRDLLDLLADLEAGLDFVDEDIEFVELDAVRARLDAAHTFLKRLQTQASQRMRPQTAFQVVLAGLPNAGKSTLFNALANEQLALVSEHRGTTRDYLTCRIGIDGTELELIDTPGWEPLLDEHAEGISAQAQRFRREQIRRADLVLWCRAADVTPGHEEYELDRSEYAEHRQHTRDVLTVQTKSDATTNRSAPQADADGRTLAISALTGSGLSALREALCERLSGTRSTLRRQWLGTTSARCAESLAQAIDALDRAQHCAIDQAGNELIALEIREALDHLGHILGEVYTDDVLDRIFSRFCIGK